MQYKNTNTLSKRALQLFTEGSSCAQAILATYGPSNGLPEDLCFKVASGLGGGVGRRQSICGAISAGAIVIGLKFGNSQHGDSEKKELTSKIVGEFVDECERVLGGSQCSTLLGIDLKDTQAKTAAKESGLLERVCNKAVEQCALILERYLTESEQTIPPSPHQ